jgi:hypothetical protein
VLGGMTVLFAAWCRWSIGILVSGSTQISAGQELGCAKRNHEL